MTVYANKPAFNIREKLTELSGNGIRFETGTFVPEIIDNSGNKASYSYNAGFYQLVGGAVYITIDLRNINSSGLVSTDQLRINNLPFVALKGSNGLPSNQVLNIKVQNGVAWGGANHLIAQVNSGSDVVTLGYISSGDTSFSGVIIDDINDGTNRDIWISGTYLIG
jgi:hypothetical protein